MKYLGWIFRAFVAYYLMSYFLIAAHELGHLTFGLTCGLEYQTFSVGSGPTIAEWVTGSGMKVHFGTYPQGGFCMLTTAGGAVLRSLPPLVQAANFWAGVAGSCFVTLLLTFITFRSVRGEGFLWRMFSALKLSYGPMVFAPFFPFILIYRAGAKSSMISSLVRWMERLEKFLEANSMRGTGGWVRFWRLAVLLAIADNAFSSVVNLTPLTRDFDGFKAMYFLMLPTGWWLLFFVVVLMWQMSFCLSVAMVGVQISRAVFSYLFTVGINRKDSDDERDDKS